MDQKPRFLHGLRLAYSAILISALFLPFCIYHSLTEPYVECALGGFHLAVGYVAAASGVAVTMYEKSVLLRKVGALRKYLDTLG
jgi:hypothetical protein